MAVSWEIHYDRRVSSGFLSNFEVGGQARLLVELAKFAPFPIDFQLRHDVKSGAEHASLYVGLTSVLNVDQTASGELRLRAHPTWANAVNKFDPSWVAGVAPNQWGDVENYLEFVIPAATKSHASREGGVQSAVSKFLSDERIMLDREAMLHFRDTPTKKSLTEQVVHPIREAVASLAGSLDGAVKEKFGGKCDLLAVDSAGRVLAVEVKPRNVPTIRWAAAQATVYAKLFERWLISTDVPASPVEVLNGEWAQRHLLGLSPKPDARFAALPQVVPIVVLQRGTKPALIDEFRLVQSRLCNANVGYPDLELWEVGMTGRPHKLHL
jgi:hypothetical protein